MNALPVEDVPHFAAAALIAALLGWVISWAADKLFMKRLMDDRVSGIALSCAFAFVVLMAADTILLTYLSPFENGPTIIPPIGYALSFIVGIGVAGAIRMRAYSHEYEFNEDQAVFDPDYDDLSRYDEEVVAWDEKHGHRNYFYRHWVGQLPLPLAYWVNGALLSTLVAAAATFLTFKIKRGGGSLRAIAIVSLLYILISLLVWIWSSVGIWRSAYWHRRRGGAVGTGVAARVVVVLSAVATVLGSQTIVLQAAEWGHLAIGRDTIGEVAEMRLSGDGRDVLIRGNLAEGAAERFAALLDRSPSVREITLTSPGGRMLEAERMADLIRQKGLDTRVDDQCMSACVTVLLAGRERSSPNLAQVGFHQPSFPGLEGAALRAAIADTANQYIRAGVDPTFVYRALATPASDIWTPTMDELIAANVLTTSEIVIRGRQGPSKSTTPREESLSDRNLRLELANEAARINANGPRKLDSMTTLKRATASGYTLTTYYRMALDDPDRERLKAVVTTALRDKQCAAPDIRSAVRDGARFVYSFEDRSGRHLFEVSLNSC